jgi:hypothetical protein
MHNIFGIITMISATTMALVALPMQIQKNYSDKKVGIHWSLVVLSFVVYLSRALFALTNAQGIIWYIFVSDAIGSISSAIMLWQTFHYKIKN